MGILIKVLICSKYKKAVEPSGLIKAEYCITNVLIKSFTLLQVLSASKCYHSKAALCKWPVGLNLAFARRNSELLLCLGD